MKIPVRRLDPQLALPAAAHPGDAGLDLQACATVELQPGERAVIGTGFAVAIPSGHVGLVAPRSGLAARLGIGVVNAPGVIDSGYRGEVKVVAVNLGNAPVTLQRGDRIAQLIVVPHIVAELTEVEVLPASVRGEDGFGSTGV